MPSFWEVKDSNKMFYTTCVTALFSGIGSFSTNHVGRRSPLTSWELKSDPKNKSPAIALFLFVGYILSFVIRFIVNAPDSLLIKHELDLEGFEHRDSLDRTSKYGSYRMIHTVWFIPYGKFASVYKLVSEKSVHFEKKCLRKQSAMFWSNTIFRNAQMRSL